MIVAGIRKDGRPHLSPNWFYWDGEHFYVSTTRKRAKYTIFRRDPRAELVVDDPEGMRYVEIPTTVEIREDVPGQRRAVPRHPGEARPRGPGRRRAGGLPHRRRPGAARLHPVRPAATWTSMNIR